MNALGRHILLELFGCDPSLLNDASYIEQSMVKAAMKAGFTVINSTFHHFSPYGVSGVVVIQESHLSIHTWPEYSFAAVDLFTCGEFCDPGLARESLQSSLAPERVEAREIQRGRADQLPESSSPASFPETETPGDMRDSDERNIWFTRREEDIALSLRHRGQVFQKESEHQTVEILDTYGFGKLLVLDGTVTCTERDEFVYHEMIAHIPAQIHRGIKTALIVGGGDGGAARELLRYPEIEHIDVVEIDPVVVEACRSHLPDLSNSLKDRRVDLHIEDAAEFLERDEIGEFDLILVDAVEHAGNDSGAFDSTFYRNIHGNLKPTGLVVFQAISPALDSRAFRHMHQQICDIFGPNNVSCYMALLPTYTTGTVSFVLASRTPVNPVSDLNPDAANAFSRANNLQYYTGEIHRAAFALPPYLRDLLES
jgi:spermidine synthase